ncbi:MAG: transposase [Gammaproteobacteria bacterium]|nr:transposase [Gammaproteobacteria bacterium]
MSKFVQADRDQPFLLPPDLRDWLPADDLAHFVLEAVERVPIDRFKVNVRGTGCAQYHPQMMLSLLIYCYANGIFASRRIERATYRDIGVRFITANCHPDHDTICAFRRENVSAISESFVEVLLMAKELKLLKVGKVSVDGTQVKANASKRRSIRYDRAQELRKQLEIEIRGLLDEAERADAKGEQDPQQLPKELARRERLKEQLDAACARLERQAKARAASEQEAYERKVAAREKRQGKHKGKQIQPPKAEPEDGEQTNLTDADSGLMRKNKRSEYRQCYNAQAVVDAHGSQLVLSARVSQCASDRNELVADIEAIPSRVGTPSQVLADNGYANGDEVSKLESRNMDVLVAVSRGDRRRRHDFRPVTEPGPCKEPKMLWIKHMKEKMERDENRAIYGLRKQTVEPVFGVMKHAMGFRHFLLRGKDKVAGEWQLLALAYNCKRMHNMVLG